MANTLTGLIAPIYKAMNVVSREQIGYIPAVTVDSDVAQRAALGQTIRASVAPAAIATDSSPSMTIPEGDDQAQSYVDLVITASKNVQIPWPGEDELAVSRGPGYPSVFEQQVQEAIRSLSNAIEADLAGSYTSASRATGTAGTTPFASGVGDSAQTRKLLRDNGAQGDFRLVLDTSAGANVRSNTNLIGANAAGTDETLRMGSLLPLSGITLHETAESNDHVKGTGSGYLVNSGALIVGSTAIPVDTGSGTILAGDVITIDGDANKYVVATELTGGTVTIAAPGLRKAPADNAAITVGDDYAKNLAFARSAIILAARGPALPSGGDAAVDRMTITDPISGLSFDVAVYVGYQKKMINVAIAWGKKVVKPEHLALLQG